MPPPGLSLQDYANPDLGSSSSGLAADDVAVGMQRARLEEHYVFRKLRVVTLERVRHIPRHELYEPTDEARPVVWSMILATRHSIHAS